jgi:phosphoglycolate phosphatase
MINLKVNGQTLRDIELIIFDKDGTLFELHSYWSIIANKRAELICKYAGLTYNYRRRDHIAYIMGVDNQNKCMRPDSMIGINKRSEIETELYDRLNEDGFEISLEDIKKAFVETDIYLENNFISNYKDCAQTTIPIRGIIKFLQQINGKCKCAVLSFDRTNNINKCLKSVGMDKHFSFVIGGDMLHNAKPDPEGAIKIMTVLGTHPSNTLMIGDTMNDILCGQSALCRCIARKSELSQISLIETTHANIINDFTEIEVI